MTFTPITPGAEHVANCPSCGKWMWKIGPTSGFFGKAGIERATRYLASDGDSLDAGVELYPSPLTAHTQWDSDLLMGACPHCGDGYWFITSSYPECPVSNETISDGSPTFICDEGYIDILDRVDGADIGDQAVAAGWVVMHQRARWEGREIRIDVHMVGPFTYGDNIWQDASDLLRAITPHAVAHLAVGRTASI